MKIYTRTGDDGTTGLIGGSRVGKDNLRIDCIGALDEINAAVGLAAVSAQAAQVEALRRVQSDLFAMGSHLALADAAMPPKYLPALDEAMIGRLEMEIDAAEDDLQPLRNFILPGGSETSARLHLARTVCRRAERLLVRFAHDRPVPALILTYLNRLSDWLFVQARWANRVIDEPDIPWRPEYPASDR
jgi:cob(I)alamin adenosyltransferase